MFNLVVHATHEAGVKVGGIGAVLAGLLASPSYNEAVERTILLGPYNAQDQLEEERLRAPRNGLTILYDTQEGIINLPEQLANAFHDVQVSYRVSILYGRRRFGKMAHEVLLVDSSQASLEPINDLKGYLYARYGFHSSKYEGNPEFDTFMSGAVAQVKALYALVGDLSEPAIFMAHEWLGLPALFAAQRHLAGQYKSVFYAHESATVRPIIEYHAAHDVRFYNAMRVAAQYGLSLEQVFGEQSAYFKHAFLRAALSLDGIFAVGDLVKEELNFLEPTLNYRQVDLVYNGVPSHQLTLEQKQHSKKLLQQYAQTLHGFYPTWIFSHVTRLIASKGIWRDIRVMERLDNALAQAGETAVFYLLSTVRPAGRRREDVYRWEWEYGWPVHHRADNGDLIDYERDYYQSVEQFNGYAKASRIVFVNQFGWSRSRCGLRMPAEMQFMDLRFGTDVEFGQSIYEPFGIAQVEPLSFGALCLLSTACGCLGFIDDAGGLEKPNIVIGDYLYLPPPPYPPQPWEGNWELHQILQMGQPARHVIESLVASEVASQIFARLPRNNQAQQELLTTGYDLSTRMSWDVVARDYLLPALKNIAS